MNVFHVMDECCSMSSMSPFLHGFHVRQGVSIHVAMGFGGWHEVNTPQDLQRRFRGFSWLMTIREIN